MQPNVKAALLAKLRAYKSDLNNLKSEVNKIVPGNLNPSARDELLESGMKDTLMVLFQIVLLLKIKMITLCFDTVWKKHLCFFKK